MEPLLIAVIGGIFLAVVLSRLIQVNPSGTERRVSGRAST